MTSVTRQQIGKRVYLYESESYRDEQGRPRNKKTSIGKIDPVTGRKVYKQDYLDRMAATGTPIIIPNTDSYLTASQLDMAVEVMDNIKNYGAVYVLSRISEETGLTDILRQSIPDYWQEILTLAYYLVLSDKPVSYCSDWLTDTETDNVGDLSSQRISELLISFGASDRHAFYEAWAAYRMEQEYVALDITSISSYSELIGDNEWGYNRDHEDLPQINLCMLMGQQSHLPIYQSVYSGSLKDVSTLQCTLSELTALVPEKKKIRLVMDKGFFSVKNINALLGSTEDQQKHLDYDFLVAVPFTSAFACRQVESERKDIDQVSHTIMTNSTPIRGVHKPRAWGSKGQTIHTHILYNPEKALQIKNDLYGLVTELKTLAETDPNNKLQEEAFRKYLQIRKSEKLPSGYTVKIREEVIESQLKQAGWLILISNFLDDVQAAHDYYRSKDVVEKSFCRFKNNLGLCRLRVQSNDRMQNKIFVGFIALILMSWLHQRMSEERLYKHMTFDKMMLTLAKIRFTTVKGQRILRPLTKEQKELLDKLGIAHPVG